MEIGSIILKIVLFQHLCLCVRKTGLPQPMYQMYFMSKPPKAIMTYKDLNVKGDGRITVFEFVRADQPDPNPGATLSATTQRTQSAPAAANTPTAAIAPPNYTEDLFVHGHGLRGTIGHWSLQSSRELLLTLDVCCRWTICRRSCKSAPAPAQAPKSIPASVAMP